MFPIGELEAPLEGLLLLGTGGGSGITCLFFNLSFFFVIFVSSGLGFFPLI